MTIVEFLEARIAEDEAAASAASPGGWQYGAVEAIAGGTLYDESRTIASLIYEQPGDHNGAIVRSLLSAEANANGQHIVRHDPARVLAECAAKRQIIEDQRVYAEDFRAAPTEFARGRLFMATLAVTHLAETYSDHPDYDNAWAA